MISRIAGSIRQRQRGEEAILSQTERSYFTSIVNSSATTRPFDLKTQRTRSWGPSLDGDNTAAASRCVFVALFDAVREQLLANTPELQQLIT